MSNLADLNLCDVASAMRAATVDSHQLAAAVRHRIERLDGELGCYRWLCLPGSVGETGIPPQGASRLWGIPYALKANIAVTGLPVDCASKMLAGWASPYDADVVTKLNKTGAQLVGLTNMDEFAMGSSTEHAWGLTTHNPWHSERVPGGSSGGSAAAVAAGLAYFALGSDTGGSVRLPAHCCGVVGLKPTYGRISRRGLVAYASSLDQIGVLARTVADTALVFGELAGHDPGDATSLDVPGFDPRDVEAIDVQGLKVGLIRGGVDGHVSMAMAQNLAASAEQLRASGACVDNVDSPWLDQALAAYAVIVAAEASANLARYDGTHFGPRIEAADHQTMARRSRSHGFGSEVQLRIMTGVHVLRAGHRDRWHRTARQVRAKVCAALQDHWQQYDALLLPTAAAGAFNLGERTDDSVAMMSADRFTVPANLAGLPAVTVPTILDDEGLPLSVQLMGPPLSEPTLLALATTIEQSGKFDVHRKEAPWQRS